MFIQRCFSKILIIILLALSCGNVFAELPKGNTPPNSISSFFNHFILHNDSIRQLNFRYADKQRGIKPFITPGLLIMGGTAFHLSNHLQENFQDWVHNKTDYTGNVAEYLPYAPLVAVYSLNAMGIKGENNFGNRTALIAKSYIINAVLVKGLKSMTDTKRPNGERKSFPSGHTSVAFAMAHFMHKEYGELNLWYSIGAYSCATSVGALRVMKNSHWLGDVVAGAGIGILSTEFVYLTHLYKWDNKHLKNFDIFPFQFGKQKGLSMVYNF